MPYQKAAEATERVCAYIDWANLHRGTIESGWELSYKKLKIWLKDRYAVERAYIFIGFLARRKKLYAELEAEGYILIYKEVAYSNGSIKGNCDSDMTLQIVVDYYEGGLTKAVVVSSDGDFAGVINFLKEKNGICALVSPHDTCSFLLRKLNVPLLYLNTQKLKLIAEKEKAPGGDDTPAGPLS